MKLTINGTEVPIFGSEVRIRLEVDPAGESLDHIDMVIVGGVLTVRDQTRAAMTIDGEDGGCVVLGTPGYGSIIGDLHTAKYDPKFGVFYQ